MCKANGGNTMKRCRTCGRRFNPTQNQVKKSDFECLKCARKRAKEYRAKRKREGNPVISGRMSAEWHKEYSKKYYSNPVNRKRRNRITRERNKAGLNALKVMARTIAHHAIERGELVRGKCSVCGGSKTEAHHRDYTKPLMIEWLCKKCHMAEHRPHRGQR